MLQTLHIVVCAGCMLAFGASVASTQSAGRLAGTIRDPAGRVVPGVTVTVTGGVPGASRTAVTDGHGRYELLLPPLSPRGDLSWQSRVFYTPFNDAIDSQAADGLVHLRAGFEPRSRPVGAGRYGRNVGGREYITGTATNVTLPAVNGRPGEPRHWGTEFTHRRWGGSATNTMDFRSNRASWGTLKARL
jgi:hypothetical protein